MDNLNEQVAQAQAEGQPETNDTTEEAVSQANELTASDVTSVAVVEGITQHTIAVPNPTKEEMAELLESLTVNYDSKVDIKPVQFNFKKTKDKDTGIETIRKLAGFIAQKDIIQKQYDLLDRELKITMQRVNLFEKIKIPESEENIRVIRIYLGDQQTNAVGRSKIAKKKIEKLLKDKAA